MFLPLVALTIFWIPASERDPGPQWLLPSLPHVQSCLGGEELLGEDVPERPIFDQGTQGISSSSIGFVVESSRFRGTDRRLDNEFKGFWTRTTVAIPGGAVLGFDANDLRQGLIVSDEATATSLKTVSSPSQLRFGGGWDLLAPFLKGSSMSLGIEGWIPAWSDGETQLRVGFRQGERWRLDAGFRQRPQAVAGSRTLADSRIDTLSPGGEQLIRDLRAGFAISDFQGQLWGGLRTLDSGASSNAWQHTGRSWFGGLRLDAPVPFGVVQVQANMDVGSERQWVLREDRQFQSAADINLLAAVVEADIAMGSKGSLLIRGQGSRLEVEETMLRNGDLLGFSGVAGGDARLTSGGLGVGWKYPIGSLALRPMVTWTRQSLSGQASAAWFAGAQGQEFLGTAGRRDLLEGRCEISWNASGSRWSYQIGRTWAVTGLGGFDISHRGTLSQSF